MLGVPDEFFTVEEVAQRLVLPPEMIRRRIESGDIPVHWVEIDGKLEMRVAAEDIGGLSGAPAFSDPFAPAQTDDNLQPAAGEPAAEEWAVTESEYSQGLWAPAEEAGTSEANPWEVNPTSALAAPEVGPSGVPVWRPDPATWDDEPLDSVSTTPAEVGFQPPATGYQTQPVELDDEGDELIAAEVEEEASEFTGAIFSPEPSDTAFATPPAPGFSFEPPAPGPTSEVEPAGPSPQYGFEPAAPSPQYGFEPAATAASFGFEPIPQAYAGDVEESEEPEEQAVEYGAVEEPEPAAATVEDDVARPSALVTSQMAGAGSVAINSIDARELVAGLFERWERALEQRIQAEQRLRFEAELEQRLRQVRDLRQELDQTRKAQAAQMAEREREMMELRNKVRDLEQAPKKGGFFRR